MSSKEPGGQGRKPAGAGGQGQDKVHTATNPTTGETRDFTQAQWKDKTFRQQLQAEGFERPEDLPEDEEIEGAEGDATAG